MGKRLKVYTRRKAEKLKGKLKPKEYPPKYKVYDRRKRKAVR